MIKNCPVCGKAFDVFYPDLWRYKRDKTFLCSYGCMRAMDDKKGVNRDMALTKAQKQAVIEMLLNGENPNEFIKNCGIKNPTCTVWNLKQYLKKYDSETWEKLQPKTETPEAPTVKVDGAIRIETPEKSKVEIVETPEGCSGLFHGTTGEKNAKAPCTKPLNYDGYDVTAIRRDELGEFYHDMKFNCVDWRTPAGDEVSLSPAGWRQLRDELPMILKILGVEL